MTSWTSERQSTSVIDDGATHDEVFALGTDDGMNGMFSGNVVVKTTGTMKSMSRTLMGQ